MTLNFTVEEAQAVREVITSKIQDLRSEISHTDKPDYKDRLKARKEILKSALAKMS